MNRIEEKQDISNDTNISLKAVPINITLPKKIGVASNNANIEDTITTKQDIIISNQELAKNYGYYDEIRRKTLGVINSLELGVVDRTNLDVIVQDCIIKAPNYWLTYAMSALSYWYMNNHESSDKALNKSLSLNDINTSLFFSLVCADNGRDEASKRWLKRYLNQVDPNNINIDTILLFDALASGTFSVSSKTMAYNKAKKWISTLLINQELVNKTKDLWIDYYDTYVSKEESNVFPFLKTYSPDFSKINDALSMAKTSDNIMTMFDKIMKSSTKKKFSIDTIITALINTKEAGEKEIANHLNKLSHKDKFLSTSNNLLDYISLIIINDDDCVSPNGKKFLLALINDVVIDAFDEFKEVRISNTLPSIMIQLEDWKEITSDASNEKELLISLNKHFEPTLVQSIKSTGYINIPIIVIPLVLIIISVALKDNILLSIIFCILAGGFITWSVMNTDKKKKEAGTRNNDLTTEITSIFNNIMAEVVDYSRTWKLSNDKSLKLHDYLNNMVDEEFINNKEAK